MIKFENPNGYIEITNAYFATLVGRAAQSCFGVTGMVNGVSVKSVDGQLQIELHISVSYGVNITAIVDSIINKVRYTVEEATDLKVNTVNVYVDALN